MPASLASSSHSQSSASTSTSSREYKAPELYSERSLSTASSSSTSLSSPSQPTTPPRIGTPPSYSPTNHNSEMLHHLGMRRMPSLSPYSQFALPHHQPHSPSPPTSPIITALHGEPASSTAAMLSPMARCRRAPAPSESPPMRITSTPYKHTLEVHFPQAIQIQPEMVTVSAKKGDKLSIVADAWHMERNCHYEWEVSFPPRDADMSAVHAKFQPGGHLLIDVRRR